jgi:hypothetical protein
MPKIIKHTLLALFSSSDRKKPLSSITNLDEALTVLLHNIPTEQRPSFNVLIRGKAISSYLVTLPHFITPGKKRLLY